jgi:uncharacterized protein YcaQ
VLAGLERDRTVIRIEVHGPDGAVPGEWLVLSDEMETLAAMEGGGWAPRTTLLSPFDPVARGRAELLFGFAHKMEIYVPKANRRYGYYVMPILHGDRLIGRLDPTMDRKSGRLTINAVHAEPGAPSDAATGRAIRASVDDLARFLGAVEITFAGGSGPAGWHRALGA